MRRLLLLLLCSSRLLAADAPGRIQWKRNFAEARDSAAAQAKFLLVYIEQRYAAESDKMDTRTWTDTAVIARSERFVCVRIDMADPMRSGNLLLEDFTQRFLPRHRVTYIPTTLVLDPAEGEVARLEGFTEAGDLRPVLDSIPPDVTRLFTLLAAVDPNGESVSARISAAEEYARLHLPAASSAYLEKASESDSVKTDPGLRERVDWLTAENLAGVSDVKSAVDRFERFLDLYPRSVRRPQTLFELARLSALLLDDVKARTYAHMLKAEFPGSAYAKDVDGLFRQ